jgi:hypothetical protein
LTVARIAGSPLIPIVDTRPVIPWNEIPVGFSNVMSAAELISAPLMDMLMFERDTGGRSDEIMMGFVKLWVGGLVANNCEMAGEAGSMREIITEFKSTVLWRGKLE